MNNIKTGIETNGIGTLSEKSLHAALKSWYTHPGDQVEVPVEGYLIDIVRGDHLIEIQTRSFSSIKPKLFRLVESYPIRLVYPIAREKWIIKHQEKDGPEIERRRSPRRGRPEHLFSELVRFPQLLAHPNFSLEILLTREEEVRVNDGKGAWRRKGWSLGDRRLLEVVESQVFETPASFRCLLPSAIEQPFTTRDLARAARIPSHLAGKMAYCLRSLAIIELVGRRGKAYLYRIVE